MDNHDDDDDAFLYGGGGPAAAPASIATAPFAVEETAAAADGPQVDEAASGKQDDSGGEEDDDDSDSDLEIIVDADARPVPPVSHHQQFRAPPPVNAPSAPLAQKLSTDYTPLTRPAPPPEGQAPQSDAALSSAAAAAAAAAAQAATAAKLRQQALNHSTNQNGDYQGTGDDLPAPAAPSTAPRLNIAPSDDELRVNTGLTEPEEELPVIWDVDPSTLLDKPWRKPGADLTDYFNYGFDEQSWTDWSAIKRERVKSIADLVVERQNVLSANDHPTASQIAQDESVSGDVRNLMAMMPPDMVVPREQLQLLTAMTTAGSMSGMPSTVGYPNMTEMGPEQQQHMMAMMGGGHMMGMGANGGYPGQHSFQGGVQNGSLSSPNRPPGAGTPTGAAASPVPTGPSGVVAPAGPRNPRSSGRVPPGLPMKPGGVPPTGPAGMLNAPSGPAGTIRPGHLPRNPGLPALPAGAPTGPSAGRAGTPGGANDNGDLSMAVSEASGTGAESVAEANVPPLGPRGSVKTENGAEAPIAAPSGPRADREARAPLPVKIPSGPAADRSGSGRIPSGPSAGLPSNVPTGPRNVRSYKDRDNSGAAGDALDYGGNPSSATEARNRGSSPRKSDDTGDNDRSHRRRRRRGGEMDDKVDASGRDAVSLDYGGNLDSADGDRYSRSRSQSRSPSRSVRSSRGSRRREGHRGHDDSDIDERERERERERDRDRERERERDRDRDRDSKRDRDRDERREHSSRKRSAPDEGSHSEKRRR